jgi:hypothetical protein
MYALLCLLHLITLSGQAYRLIIHTMPLSDESSGESERLSSPSTHPAPDQFSITKEDVAILKVHIGNFQKAKTETRNKILETVMGELYALRPPSSAFNKRVAKKVFVPNIWNGITDKLLHYRRSERGFTTTMNAPIGNLSNSPGTGQAGTPTTIIISLRL